VVAKKLSTYPQQYVSICKTVLGSVLTYSKAYSFKHEQLRSLTWKGLSTFLTHLHSWLSIFIRSDMNCDLFSAVKSVSLKNVRQCLHLNIITFCLVPSVRCYAVCTRCLLPWHVTWVLTRCPAVLRTTSGLGSGATVWLPGLQQHWSPVQLFRTVSV
jgi:hypothetical protein